MPLPDGCPSFPNVAAVTKAVAALLLLESSKGTGSQPTENQAAKIESPCLGCFLIGVASIDANGLAASGILRGKGIRANREPSGKDRKPLPLWYLNPRSERNRSQQRAAKPLRYNLQYSERPTDFVIGSQQAKRLPLLRKPLPPCRFWNPQRERNRSQRRTERQDGCRSSDGCRWCCLDVGCSIDANGLALPLLEPSEGKEAATKQGKALYYNL